MLDKIKMFERHLVKEEKADNTIKKYVQDVKEFYNYLEMENYKATAVGETLVSKEILLKFKNHLRKSKLKITTINSKISSLNAFLKYIEYGSFKLKVLKCQKSIFGTKEKELKIDEFKRLCIASNEDERLKLIMETLAKTGARASELKFITIKSLKIGKVIVFNKNKERIIILPRKLCIKLRDYYRKKKFSKAQFIKNSDNDINNLQKQNIEIDIKNEDREIYEPIFTTRNGTPIDRKQLWQMMKRLSEKAKVDKAKVFPHNLRHLFAREFYRATHDIVKLSSILGHCNIETTRIYAKETEDECRMEMERISFIRD